MRLIFFDTEFSSLDADAKLISVGMADGSSGQFFYAELSDTWTERDASKFVRQFVLPVLGSPEKRISLPALAGKLSSWLEAFGEPVQLATESLKWDWKWIIEILGEPGGKTWPANLAHQPYLLTMNYIEHYDQFVEALERAFQFGDLRCHHARDDAIAYRQAWIMSQNRRWHTTNSGHAEQNYLKAQMGYDNPVDLINALTPQSIDDLIRINRDKFKAYLTTTEEIEALSQPIPDKAIKANVIGWTFLTFYNVDKAEAGIFLVGTYPKTTRPVFTSPVQGVHGDLVVTKSQSVYKLEGESTDAPDLRFVTIMLNERGMNKVFGLPHVFY